MEQTMEKTTKSRRAKGKLPRTFTHKTDYETLRVLVKEGIPAPVSAQWLADYLGLSRFTLASWRGKGYGPKWNRFGRVVRYEFADVLDYFRNGEREPPKEFPSIF